MELRKFRTKTRLYNLFCTALHCTDHVYPAVEEPVLLDGDEALHLPAELVRGLAGHHPRSVELRSRGPPVNLDILPGRQGHRYYLHYKVNEIRNLV